MKRTRSRYASTRSRSSSPELGTADVRRNTRTLRVPVTPTKAGAKEFGSPLPKEKGGGAAPTAPAPAPAPSGTTSSSMLPPPSPNKTGRQHRRRAPLSHLQETAGGIGSTHDSESVATAPLAAATFQSPSKHRFSLPHAPPPTTAAAAAQVSMCSPPRVVIAGGAMRVLTPAKAARPRASLGGSKRRHNSGEALVVGGAATEGDDGTPLSDSSSGSGDKLNRKMEGESSSSSSVHGPPSEGSGVTVCAGGEGRKGGSGALRSSYHAYGAARRVSSRSSSSGRRSQGEGEQEDNTDDDGDYGDGRGGSRLALNAARVNARKISRSGSNSSSGIGSSAAADRRASESSRRINTTLRRVSGSRAGSNAAANRGAEGDAGKGVVSQRHLTAPAAASRITNGGERVSLELAGGSSWGPLGLSLDGPRRVSTWSDNSGGSSGSSSSNTSIVGHAGAKDGLLPAGRRSVSRSAGASTAIIRNRSSSTGGSNSSSISVSASGGAELAGRRVSAARRFVGAACEECEGRKAEGRGDPGEGLPCEGCAAQEAAGQRPKRAREGSGGVIVAAQPIRRRSAAAPTATDVTVSSGRGSGGGTAGAASAAGDGRLSGQDLGRRMRIDDFEVRDKLGKGKFGIVYKAKCKLSNKTVAIKMIYKSYLRDGIPQDRVNLDRERRLQAQVRHPNIVGVQNCFQDPKFVYLVLDYAANGDMFKVLSRHKNGLPLETAASYLRDAASAVEHLHSVHIMHRDIKAENLLLDSKRRLKLSDFGWAVLAKPPLDHRQTMCGTPEYAAPEIVACNRKYTKAVDIWSLGVLAFELLTGQTPFANPMASATKQRTTAAGSGNNSGKGGVSADMLPPPPLEKHNASDTNPPTSTTTGAPAAGAVAETALKNNAATAAEIEAVHRGDVHARLYGRIAGWSGSRDSLFGPGRRGASVPGPARDVVMGMLRPRPEDRLEAREVLRLPWVASRGRGDDGGGGGGGGGAAGGL